MSPDVIDVHTHAFPDGLAERAIRALEADAPCTALLDGRVSSLLASMDAAGIRSSVIANIATKPSQFESILAWCLEIASERIIPLASVHPDDPEAPDRIHRIAESGLKGIKLHPYYQGFTLDEERMNPIYAALQRHGLVLLSHTGFDIAFERKRIADPARICSVVDRFPELKLITSHCGGWEDWDQVEELIVGRPIAMDISYSLGMIPREQAERFFKRHPTEYVLFGTDSPWGGQRETLEWLRSFGLDEATMRAVLHDNAARILGLRSGRSRKDAI